MDIKSIIKKLASYSRKSLNQKDIVELRKGCIALGLALDSVNECGKCGNIVDKNSLVRIIVNDSEQEMCRDCVVKEMKGDPKKKKAKSGKARGSKATTASKSKSTDATGSKPPATKTVEKAEPVQEEAPPQDPPPKKDVPEPQADKDKKKDTAFDRMKKDVKKILGNVAVQMSPEATVQYLRSELKDKLKEWSDDTVLMALNQLAKQGSGKTDNTSPDGWN